jgi:hypothetical protein
MCMSVLKVILEILVIVLFQLLTVLIVGTEVTTNTIVC